MCADDRRTTSGHSTSSSLWLILTVLAAAAMVTAGCGGQDSPERRSNTPPEDQQPPTIVAEPSPAGPTVALPQVEPSQDPDEGPARDFVSYEEFRASLYCEAGGELCIVERDVPLVGEQAIRDYYDRIVHSAEPRPNALTVMHVDDRDAKWDVQTRMNLTYCVSDDFGSRKQSVIDAMDTATTAWEDAAVIDFKYVAAEDADCTTDNNAVLFPVIPAPSGATYLGRSFFPNYPDAYMSLNLNLPDFDAAKASGGELGQNLTVAGILRHELGHILGFRHEHIRPEAQAYQCAEDDQYRPITAYDSESVMHYPQCNGDGDWSLTLTQLDRQGAAQYYPAQPTADREPQRCTRELDDDGYVREECAPVKNEILRVVNTATRQQLDVELHLDVRAADGIIQFRQQKDFETFDELRSVSYVTDNVIRDIYDVLYHGDCQFTVDADGNYPIACLTTVFDILDAANTASYEQLDVDMALDARAAGNIVAIRADNPFETMDELWAVSYVKQQAVMNIYAWVQQQGVSVDITTDVDSGLAPLAVDFVANPNGGAAPFSYEWDFGDGTATATGQNAAHTYQGAGDYTATVTVTDADGQTNTDTVDIHVEQSYADLVITDLTITPDGQHVAVDVTIQNQGNKTVTDYFWVDFYADRDAAPDSGDLGKTIEWVDDDIAPGQTLSLSQTFRVDQIGTLDGYALIDSTGHVDESDETNNAAGPVVYSLDYVLINEVLYTTAGPDSGTFIELYGQPGRDLTGYKLEAVNGRDGGSYDTIDLPQGTTIPADGYLVIGDANTANADVVTAKSDLQNGPDNVLLVAPDATVVDALGYGQFDDSETFAGEGSPAAATPNGYSAGRNATSTDTGDNAADFYQWAIPTPGAVNEVDLSGQADTCADAYTISDGVEGRFEIQGNLGGLSNDFATLNVDQCSATSSALSGADQVLKFVVPDGVTADVDLTLDEAGTSDIDAAITDNPCASLEDGFRACNALGFTSLSGLPPGAYYIVVFQDGSSPTTTADEPYTYAVDIAYQ